MPFAVSVIAAAAVVCLAAAVGHPIPLFVHLGAWGLRWFWRGCWGGVAYAGGKEEEEKDVEESGQQGKISGSTNRRMSRPMKRTTLDTEGKKQHEPSVFCQKRLLAPES